jgi:hypothetical protein
MDSSYIEKPPKFYSDVPSLSGQTASQVKLTCNISPEPGAPMPLW